MRSEPAAVSSTDPSAGLPRVAAIVAAVLLVAAVLVHGLRPIIDLDLWWHMRLGELLLQGADTRVDMFSYTQAGTPWPWKDAGAAILFHGLWQVGGPWMVIAFKALAFGATAWLVWRLLRVERGVPASLALVVSAATLDAVAFRFTERAASLSLLVLVAVLVLIERDRKGARGLWWVIPLTIVNANLHRAALLLPVVVGVHAVARFVELRLLRPRARGRDGDGDGDDDARSRARAWQRPVLVAIGCALGCLVTPYGPAIVTTTVALMGQHSPLITEWSPVSIDLIERLTPASFATIGLTVVGTALGQWRRRPWAAWDLALAVLALGLGLSSMRHLPVLALLGAGPAASGLAQLGRRTRSQSPVADGPWTGRLRGLIGVTAAGVLLASTLARPVALPGRALAPAHFPERGLAFVQQLPPPLALRGRMFNEFGYGGFLLFHLWPQHRVYIDGRTDLVYPASLVERYVQCLHDGRAFAQEAREREIDWVWLDNVPHDAGRLHFDLDPAWTLVHASRRALIYVRRDGPNAELARTHGYRRVAAHDLIGSIRHAASRGHGEAAIEELRRMVDEDPDNVHAVAALLQLAPGNAMP